MEYYRQAIQNYPELQQSLIEIAQDGLKLFQEGLPKIVIFFGYMVFVIVYVRYFIAILKPGLNRLGFSLPVMIFNLTLPAMFLKSDNQLLNLMIYPMLAMSCGFHWNTRLFEFSMNRGIMLQAKSIWQMIPMFFVPISWETGEIEDEEARDQTRKTNYPRAIAKTAVLGLSMVTIVFFAEDLNPFFLSYISGLSMMILVSLNDDRFMRRFLARYGIIMRRNFNEPYLSKSVAEFWNRRWNYVTGKYLRDIAYAPIVEGKFVNDEGDKYRDVYQERKEGKIKPKTWQLILAAFTVFFLSGVMHQLPIWYLSQNKWNLGQLIFFTIQAPIVVVERYVYGALKKQGVNVPLVVRIAITHLIFVTCAHYFFLYSNLQLMMEPQIQDSVHNANSYFEGKLGVNLIDTTFGLRNNMRQRIIEFLRLDGLSVQGNNVYSAAVNATQ